MKKTSASNLLNIRGKGNTCRIKIGGIVEVSFPEPMNLSPLGSFRITEMEHTVKRDGHYSNEFWGIPSSSEYIPINENIPLPMATPEMATVTSNADEQNQGRVKVRLDWQNDEQTTNWIRVQSSNAGCSEKVGTNRGYMFIPEENDRVMVNYEQGRPKPAVCSRKYIHSKDR
ncbi:phage baseplate assembly protein V [Bacteroides thetaiotaomicron]|nr:phage baseplate assembly protein V [Bacteroides thetaiotaomicron]